jgi:hypothetical protein
MWDAFAGSVAMGCGLKDYLGRRSRNNWVWCAGLSSERARNGREAELHCTINVNVAVCFNVPELPVDLIL